ncbi:MAG: putative Fe-S cluster assembly protein SufT, partial [Candidatus Binatia bacterium]
MSTEKPLTLKRDCAAIMIPSGEQISLPSGSKVWLTQTGGSGYSVMTDHGYSVRVNLLDGDALGLPQVTDDAPADAKGSV